MLDFDTFESARWRPDPAFDGRFFTGVKTTGIYCRPVYPVRQPLTRNVEYFASAAAALDRGSVGALAERLGVGPRHLGRLFQRHLGASPAQTAATLRLHRAKRLLTDTDLPMTEIAERAGFGSLRRFNATIRAAYGHAPSALRRREPAVLTDA